MRNRRLGELDQKTVARLRALDHYYQEWESCPHCESREIDGVLLHGYVEAWCLACGYRWLEE